MTTTEPTPLPLTLGQQLAAARGRTGLDQGPFGAELGVNRTTISRWERDIASPPFPTVVRISDRTGWPLELFARAADPHDHGPDQGRSAPACITESPADILPFRHRRLHRPSLPALARPA